MKIAILEDYQNVTLRKAPGPWTEYGASSGIHSAIHGKIRSRDVR